MKAFGLEVEEEEKKLDELECKIGDGVVDNKLRWVDATNGR